MIRSLAATASEIIAEAREIATLTTSWRAQEIAQDIARLASELTRLDLETPACGCWVCQGRPDDSHETACETARDDAAAGLRMPGSAPDYEPSAEELDEQLLIDAQETEIEDRARARAHGVFADIMLQLPEAERDDEAAEAARDLAHLPVREARLAAMRGAAGR